MLETNEIGAHGCGGTRNEKGVMDWKDGSERGKRGQKFNWSLFL